MLAAIPQLAVVDLSILFVVPAVVLVMVVILRKRNARLRAKHLDIKEPTPTPGPETPQLEPASQVIFVDLSPKSADLVELAVEIWRIQNRIGKAGSDLQEIQKRGLESSVQKLQKYLDTFRIAIVDHANQKYNEGMNVDVLSFEIDPEVAFPLIKETIEPSITCEGKVIRKGKVVVIKNN